MISTEPIFEEPAADKDLLEAKAQLRIVARMNACMRHLPTRLWQQHVELRAEARKPLIWLARYADTRNGRAALEGSFGTDVFGVLVRNELRSPMNDYSSMNIETGRLLQVSSRAPGVAERVLREWAPSLDEGIRGRGIARQDILLALAPAFDSKSLRKRALECCLTCLVASRYDVRAAALVLSSKGWDGMTQDQASSVVSAIFHAGRDYMARSAITALHAGIPDKVAAATSCAWGCLAMFPQAWTRGGCAPLLEKVASVMPDAVEGILLGAAASGAPAKTIRDIISVYTTGRQGVKETRSIAIAGIGRALQKIAQDGGVVFGPAQSLALLRHESSEIRCLAILNTQVCSERAVKRVYAEPQAKLRATRA